jgi:TPR repeat protein
LGWTVPPSLKPWLRAVGFACAVGFSRLLWQTFDTKPTDNAYTKAYDQQRAKALRDLDSPKYLTVPVTPSSPIKAKPLGEVDGKKPNSGTMANPQSGLYDMGVDSFKKKDYVRAKFLFTQACDAGEMKACNYLGYLYAQGLGGDQNREKARDLYQRACDKGTLSSCASLGSLYQDAGNTDEARRYFQEACKGGVAESCRLLREVE